MLRFEKILETWLKTYPIHSIVSKCISYRAYDNNPYELHKLRPWLIPLILKYGLLHGKNQVPSQNEKVSDDIFYNKILSPLVDWEKRFQDELISIPSAKEPIRALITLRLFAFAQFTVQESIYNIYFKLRRYISLFLEDLNQDSKFFSQFEEVNGFSIKDYFYTFFIILGLLEKSKKEYPILGYPIYELTWIDPEHSFSEIPEELIPKKKRRKIFELISKNYCEAKNLIEGELSKTGMKGPENEALRFFDSSIIEEKFPLLRFDDKHYIVTDPHIVVRSSYKFLYQLLRDTKKHFPRQLKGDIDSSLERHCFKIASQLKDQNYSVFDEKSSNIELGLNKDSLTELDLLITKENYVFICEVKNISFGRELKYSLDPKKYIEKLYELHFYAYIAQLAKQYKLVQNNDKYKNKKYFLFLITLDEIYLPNFHALKECIFNKQVTDKLIISLQDKGEKQKNIQELKNDLNIIQELDNEKLFIISIHNFSQIINGLKNKFTLTDFSDSLEKSAGQFDPRPFLSYMNFGVGDKLSFQTREWQIDATQELLSQVPNEDWNLGMETMEKEWKEIIKQK